MSYDVFVSIVENVLVPGCRILSLHLDGDFYKHKDGENYFMSV